MPHLRRAMLIALMASGFGCDFNPIVARRFIYEAAPYPSCHASTIADSHGVLVAAWFGGTREKDRDVSIWSSRYIDGGWTEQVMLAEGVQPDGSRLPCWNPVLFQPSTGPLLLFYKVGPSPEEWWGMMMTSDDRGATWSPPRRLPDGMLGPIKNKPVELPNGDILCPSSTESNEEPSVWRVHFEVASDHGATWRRIGPINEGAAWSAIQPSILFLGGDRLAALGRTRQGRVFQVFSDDMGSHWGEMAASSLPNPNAGTDAVTLRDGRHLMVYNHTATEPGRWGGHRSPLNIAVSDDARTWRAALVLEDEPGEEFSYPAVIQSADGLVHITYTWKRKRIRHVVIDPSRLSSEPMRDGLWP